MRTLQLPTPEDTAALGAAAAANLPAAAQLFVLELSGELGAGKTSFARALLQALGVRSSVRSPSYGLMELYEVAGWQVLHLDLYRLVEAAELAQLGLRDYASGRSLWLIEWPEKGGGYLPDCDARLHFAIVPDGHSVRIEARSAAGRVWAALLESDPR